jgi:hypothetical protein
MGTRGFVGVVTPSGVLKIGYNHFDSYPEELGKNTFLAVKGWMEGTGGEIEHRAQQAEDLRLVGEEPPTAEDILKLAPNADRAVSTGRVDDWYVLLRNYQGDINGILDCGYVEDASEFPYDSLFCEWGYLVDFEKRTFEVYEGFQKTPPERGRWAGDRSERDVADDSYYAVDMIATFPLGALPADTEEFLRVVKGASGYSDEG